MPKRNSEKLCCVCLGNTLKLNKLAVKDVNEVTLCTKLKICIPEIEWSATYKICEQCSKLLDISYTFRETCLQSDFTRQRNHNDVLDKIKREIEKREDDEMDDISEDVLGETDNKSEDEDQEEFVKIEDGEDDDPNSEYGEDKDSESYTSENDEKLEGQEYEPKRRKRKKISEFTCEKCDSVYNSSIKLVSHCVSEHGMKKLDVRPFACDRCPSRFCNSSNLVQHVKYHEAIRSNICTYCGKGFITKTDLNIHEKQHLNKREYKCDECGKCFNTHKDIRSHKLVVHTDSNNWKYCCEICNKPFPIKSNYDSHMRRHTGDKKFECHLCQRRFTDKCVLQRHMRTHSNVREYKCSHCDREYKDPRVLKVHMAKIHAIGVGQIKIPAKEKKYICHICPKSYYAKNKLTRHLYTHSGEKPFECEVCGKKFNDKSYVKQHLRKTHNMLDVKEENADILVGITQDILSTGDVNVPF
ncbi:zinc finger protein 2-like isoform X1 [Euwallacea fornicatus]|uniref:zinc finger protein 2-like isoform X1 n=1 Tax=Euwallacea fornicatus TaxID=995702 RepID=UPI00338EABB7